MEEKIDVLKKSPAFQRGYFEQHPVYSCDSGRFINGLEKLEYEQGWVYAKKVKRGLNQPDK